MISLRQLLVRFSLCLVLGLTLSNCGGTPYYEAFDDYQQKSDGIYHPVQKGQTLYAIAKAYGVRSWRNHIKPGLYRMFRTL